MGRYSLSGLDARRRSSACDVTALHRAKEVRIRLQYLLHRVKDVRFSVTVPVCANAKVDLSRVRVGLESLGDT